MDQPVVARDVPGTVPEQDQAPLPSLAGVDFARLRGSVVLYSNFRAGSHMLQSCLSALTSLDPVGEVFARRAIGETSFNAFIESGLPDLRELLLDPERQVPRYLAYLLETVPQDAPLIFSLKYSQAHRLGADDMTSAPLILKILSDYRVPILHLIRRDVVQQAISHLVATETNRFHAEPASETGAPRSLWLDPGEVLSLARARAEEQRRARAHLRAISARHLTVHYEELAGDRLAPELRRVLRFLDRYAAVPEGFRPATTALRSDRQVANRGEIYEHLLAEAQDLTTGLPD